MHYDGIMFGNGMTINLLQQLKPLIPKNKIYLLSIDAFLKCFCYENITPREERIIVTSLYGTKANEKKKYVNILKQDLRNYFERYNANIEYFWGSNLFNNEFKKQFNLLTLLFPALYNIWYNVLEEYLKHLGLARKIRGYYSSVVKELGNPKYVWTTNFDLFSESIHPGHVHGSFIHEMKRYEDIVYKFTDSRKHYYFKCIWGYNGIGKSYLIHDLRQFNDCSSYFDFNYFFDNTISIDRMLIYGIGFQNSGYIDDLKTVYPKYQKASLGGIVDEHILLRINGLQEQGKLNHVDVSYFDDNEKQHLIEVLDETKVRQYNLVKSQTYNFVII